MEKVASSFKKNIATLTTLVKSNVMTADGKSDSWS
jgi:hypothetical protein